MNILCPNCRSSISKPDHDPLLKCGICGLELDLSKADTFAGVSSVPIIRDLTGETIGRYNILELLGVGGMGVVYKAESLDNNRTVAFKVLHYDYLNKSLFVKRFEREAEALFRLNHPNIVKILDSGKQDGLYFLVTEYTEGLNLAQHLRSNKTDPRDTLNIMTQVCEAISYSHKHGILHRDLKPANIFLSNGSVKVLDFGLAEIIGEESQFSSLTRTNLAMGTFNYLSPEQRLNAKAVDERSDIYSLGVILYEMLTDTLPLGSFEPPSKCKPGISKKFDRIVTRCLYVSPDQRYRTVDELITALRGFDNGAQVKKNFLTLAGAAAAVFILFLALWPNRLDIFVEKPETQSWKVLQESALNLSDATVPAAKSVEEEKLPTPEVTKKTLRQPVQALPQAQSEKTGPSISIPPQEEENRGIQKQTAVPKKIKNITISSSLVGVTIYNQPSAKSPIIEENAQIEGYTILKAEQHTKKGPAWLYIRTTDGREGWIQRPKK